jgi:hypothetical protein
VGANQGCIGSGYGDDGGGHPLFQTIVLVSHSSSPCPAPCANYLVEVEGQTLLAFSRLALKLKARLD